MTLRDLRVLIVDDAATSRCVLADMLGEFPGIEVVGTAADGSAGIRLLSDLNPDLVVLDLEMPKMDGFTFLRLVMANRPTPVIVVSSHATRDYVFRALELGAIDFVAKPDSMLRTGVDSIRDQLGHMINVVRSLSPLGWQALRVRSPHDSGQYFKAAALAETAATDQGVEAPGKVVVIAASTGGPAALLEVFARVPASASACVLVAQHMPEKFTRSFAERLDRLSGFRVREAQGRQQLRAGMALVCPGGQCLEVQRKGNTLTSEVVAPSPQDRYAPSADRLFETAARSAGRHVIGVVLTGMGEDGAHGAKEIKRQGGVVLVESEETAVVYGMPKAASSLSAVDDVLPLSTLVERLVTLLT